MQKGLNPILAKAVNQYLNRTGLTALADAFKDECEIRNINIKKSSSTTEKTTTINSKFPETNDLKKRLIQAIEKNDKNRFFRLFSEAFPPPHQSTTAAAASESIAALEFQFQVYFATSPLRKTPPDRNEYREKIQELKTYLEEGNGSRMAKNSDLLPYFALPYVNDPMKHPVFRELLSKKHAKQLQDTLLRFMNRNASTTTASARINSEESESDGELKIVSWKNAYDNQKYPPSQSQPQKLEKIRVQDYQDLQEDYYKIIEIASELIDCLEQTCSGKTISPDLFAEISNRLVDSNYEAERRMQKSAMAVNHHQHHNNPHSSSIPQQQINNNNSMGGGGVGNKRNRSLNNNRNPDQRLFPRRQQQEIIKKAESTGNLIPADPKARTSPPHTRFPAAAAATNNISTNSSMTIIPKISSNNNNNSNKASLISQQQQFNFAKISNQLIKNPGTRSSALLLQALRLQLTKKRSTLEALPILNIFAEKDILLLKNKKNSVVATIVAQSEASHETKEELSRFLNALSSFKRGREYLLSIFQGKELLYHLALALRTKKLVGFAAEHSLATLEKLSVRSNVQKELVLSGMIEWTLNFLDNSPSNFGYEYGIALITNLFLHSVAQSTIFRYKDKVLSLLSKLLEIGNIQLIPFAANALYTLFSFAKMRSAAKEAKFEQIIEKCLQRIDSIEIENQLIVVLRVLQGDFDPQQLKRQQQQQHQNQQQQQHEAATGDDENDEDYIEAEIDSTDTLIPTMMELFGEQLINKKYSFQQQPNNPSNSNIIINEDIAPPGTVLPRRHYQVSHVSGVHQSSNKAAAAVPTKATPRRGGGNFVGGNTNINLKKQQQQQHGRDHSNSIPPVPLPPSSPPLPDNRMSSVASYATFIAENDKRKPLIGYTGLKAAVNALKHQKKVVNRLKEVSIFIEPETYRCPPPPKKQQQQANENSKPPQPPQPSNDHQHPSQAATTAKYRIRRKSESQLDEDQQQPPAAASLNSLGHASIVKATSTSILADNNIREPVMGKINSRIPEDANINEYTAAFGSRPKVVRTPEASSSSSGKPKATVFLF